MRDAQDVTTSPAAWYLGVRDTGVAENIPAGTA